MINMMSLSIQLNDENRVRMLKETLELSISDKTTDIEIEMEELRINSLVTVNNINHIVAILSLITDSAEPEPEPEPIITDNPEPEPITDEVKDELREISKVQSPESVVVINAQETDQLLTDEVKDKLREISKVQGRDAAKAIMKEYKLKSLSEIDNMKPEKFLEIYNLLFSKATQEKTIDGEE